MDMGFASKDTRDRAVAAYKTGNYTQAQVGEMYGVHYKTVANWMKADAEGREQIPREKGHARGILSPEDLEKIDEIMTANPSTTLNDLRRLVGKACSLPVYSRALKKLGFTFKKNSAGGRTRAGRYKGTKGRMEGMEQGLRSQKSDFY